MLTQVNGLFNLFIGFNFKVFISMILKFISDERRLLNLQKTGYIPARVAHPKQPIEKGVFDAPNLQILGYLNSLTCSLKLQVDL